MNKLCIFDSKKICDDCGECMICDLDRNKKCDNCGACLEMEGHDMKEIQIDEIIDELDETDNELELPIIKEDISTEEEAPDFELIDDIEGLDQIIEELKGGDKSEKLGYTEEYPGLIIKRK